MTYIEKINNGVHLNLNPVGARPTVFEEKDLVVEYKDEVKWKIIFDI